ncbi:NAD-dependent epimerase/dehydratase family protein [Roseateles sp. BYS180W]|uniref:NAD-dependent epimerase/dehydratase family protein n=1 Tax=Roseateles rivi TaxID=3299028 RepID=A0ABW7FUG2_9BURK
MSNIYKILLCGARGFIGRQVAAALRAQGHEVVPAVRTATPGAGCVVDFARFTRAEDWRAALAGVDAVVNAVGVLRERATQPMQALHADAPIALFEACAAQGIRRVLHISALGIDASPSAYASTKRQAEEALWRLNRERRLKGTVLRPSIVFGPGGASTALLVHLAHWPVLPLPRAVKRCLVQPVAVQDLAQVCVRLLGLEQPPELVNAVGPQALSLGELLASLRQQLGRTPARTVTLPECLTQFSARVGDGLPWQPWGREALQLLQAPNVAAAQPFASLLGHPALPPDRLMEALQA